MAGWVKSFVFAIADRRHRLPARPADRRPARRRSAIAATRAVVSGIVLLVVVDGVFAVIYYLLDIMSG